MSDSDEVMYTRSGRPSRLAAQRSGVGSVASDNDRCRHDGCKWVSRASSTDSRQSSRDAHEEMVNKHRAHYNRMWESCVRCQALIKAGTWKVPDEEEKGGKKGGKRSTKKSARGGRKRKTKGDSESDTEAKQEDEVEAEPAAETKKASSRSRRGGRRGKNTNSGSGEEDATAATEQPAEPEVKEEPAEEKPEGRRSRRRSRDSTKADDEAPAEEAKPITTTTSKRRSRRRSAAKDEEATDELTIEIEKTPIEAPSNVSDDVAMGEAEGDKHAETDTKESEPAAAAKTEPESAADKNGGKSDEVAMTDATDGGDADAQESKDADGDVDMGEASQDTEQRDSDMDSARSSPKKKRGSSGKKNGGKSSKSRKKSSSKRDSATRSSRRSSEKEEVPLMARQSLREGAARTAQIKANRERVIAEREEKQRQMREAERLARERSAKQRALREKQKAEAAARELAKRRREAEDSEEDVPPPKRARIGYQRINYNEWLKEEIDPRDLPLSETHISNSGRRRVAYKTKNTPETKTKAKRRRSVRTDRSEPTFDSVRKDMNNLVAGIANNTIPPGEQCGPFLEGRLEELDDTLVYIGDKIFTLRCKYEDEYRNLLEHRLSAVEREAARKRAEALRAQKAAEELAWKQEQQKLVQRMNSNNAMNTAHHNAINPFTDSVLSTQDRKAVDLASPRARAVVRSLLPQHEQALMDKKSGEGVELTTNESGLSTEVEDEEEVVESGVVLANSQSNQSSSQSGFPAQQAVPSNQSTSQSSNQSGSTIPVAQPPALIKPGGSGAVGGVKAAPKTTAAVPALPRAGGATNTVKTVVIDKPSVTTPAAAVSAAPPAKVSVPAAIPAAVKAPAGSAPKSTATSSPAKVAVSMPTNMPGNAPPQGATAAVVRVGGGGNTNSNNNNSKAVPSNLTRPSTSATPPATTAPTPMVGSMVGSGPVRVGGSVPVAKAVPAATPSVPAAIPTKSVTAPSQPPVRVGMPPNPPKIIPTHAPKTTTTTTTTTTAANPTASVGVSGVGAVSGGTGLKLALPIAATQNDDEDEDGGLVIDEDAEVDVDGDGDVEMTDAA